MERRLHFAYGSNMDEAQMACRCPEAVFLSTARLPGYRFLINARGVATIVRDPKSEVYGVLWSITPDDKQSLDCYEGVAVGHYRKDELQVKTLDGTEYLALVYIAADDTCGKPRPNYMQIVISAAEAHRLPGHYVEVLTAWQKTDSGDS